MQRVRPGFSTSPMARKRSLRRRRQLILNSTVSTELRREQGIAGIATADPAMALVIPAWRKPCAG